MLSPEPPYPLHGGGAFRTASLLHYLATISKPDLILLSESGQPSLLPEGIVASQRVVGLPVHRKDKLSRYLRNARRAFEAVPPLVDRLARLESAIRPLLGSRRWDLGVIEHFWCAPYVDLLSRHCNNLVLDLHNVESVLHERCSLFTSGLVKAGHERFAAACRRMEEELLPRFALVLATSEADAALVRAIAPGARVAVFPNTYPETPLFSRPVQTSPTDSPKIVFSGNFEYHPNIDAVDYLLTELWPSVLRQHPALRLRLVGRGDAFIRDRVAACPSMNIELTGPVESALHELAAADIVIAPLRIGSGTRLKIIEAWAAATPVVATRLAAEGLAAVDRENILFAETPAEFASAIGELLASPILQAHLGAAGRAAFEARYTWQAAWRILDDVFVDAQLMSGHGLTGYTE